MLRDNKMDRLFTYVPVPLVLITSAIMMNTSIIVNSGNWLDRHLPFSLAFAVSKLFVLFFCRAMDAHRLTLLNYSFIPFKRSNRSIHTSSPVFEHHKKRAKSKRINKQNLNLPFNCFGKEQRSIAFTDFKFFNSIFKVVSNGQRCAIVLVPQQKHILSNQNPADLKIKLQSIYEQ